MNQPWPIRLVPSVVWRSFFWILRNGAAAARQGWEAAGAQVTQVQRGGGLHL